MRARIYEEGSYRSYNIGFPNVSPKIIPLSQKCTLTSPSLPFNFLLGFCGGGVVPIIVGTAVSRFVQSVFTMRMKPWEALVETFGRDPLALRHCPVVLFWKDEGRVHQRVLAYSVRETRVWGVEWECGGKPGGEPCDGLPGDLRTKVKGTNHASAQFICAKCHWKTGWVARPERFIKEIKDNPFLFSYGFPVSRALLDQVKSERGPNKEDARWKRSNAGSENDPDIVMG
jgi:hypothetical protein